MEQKIQLYDAVALIVDLPEHNLYCGQVGYAIEELAPDVYEVEFSDISKGQTFAMLPLKAEQLMALHYAPVQPSEASKEKS